MLTWIVIVASVAVLVAVPVAERRARRRFVLDEGAFRCRARACRYPSTLWPRLTRRWSRPMLAAWDGDVLLVRRGPVFGRVLAVRAQISADVHALPPGEVRGCGLRPIAVCLLVPDGSRMELAADDDSRLALVGPYLTAAVNDLPRAPLPRRQS